MREKEAALRDDDNVFDVSYENQGDNTADILSAKDIKANCPPLPQIMYPIVLLMMSLKTTKPMYCKTKLHSDLEQRLSGSLQDREHSEVHSSKSANSSFSS